VRDGHSVLQIPVPELEPFVLERHRHYDPDFVSSDPRFVHAHITALGPFLPPVAIDAEARSRIAEIASGTGEFTFRLAEIASFPNGIIHLVPEPGAPFRALTAALAESFPQCPPYAAEFPSVAPHLTLDAVSDSVSESSTRELLGDLVPVTCRAERLDLAWWGNGTCRVLESWSLSTARLGPAPVDAALSDLRP
jgi:2'-5' RNA ligase